MKVDFGRLTEEETWSLVLEAIEFLKEAHEIELAKIMVEKVGGKENLED